MTFRRVIVSLAAVWALSACSNGDTIVALNVSATDAVPVVDQLHVTITQGSRRHVYDFTPPTETPEGDDAPPPSIKNTFFERITLPEGWSEEPALITVEAEADGNPFDPPLGNETTVTIEPEGVVAAYIQLDIPAEPPGNEGGAAGATGAAGETGAGGAGGATSSGDAGAGGAISPSEGGAGGAAGAEAAAGAGGA